MAIFTPMLNNANNPVTPPEQKKKVQKEESGAGPGTGLKRDYA